MNTRQFFSIMAMCVAFMASAQDATNNRTQEQFQQELAQFGEETRAMMMQEFIPADSTDMLSEKQIQVLQYTKNLAKKIKNTIELPIEVNNLITDNKECIKSILQFNNAYFVKRDNYEAMLCVPAVAQVDSSIVESELVIALDKEGNYHQIVNSTFVIPSDSCSEYLCLKSNISGSLLSTVVFNDDKIIAEIDAKGYPWGVIDSPKENNFDNERMRRDEKYRLTQVRGANYYKYSAILKHNGKMFVDTKGKVHFY